MAATGIARTLACAVLLSAAPAVAFALSPAASPATARVHPAPASASALLSRCFGTALAPSLLQAALRLCAAGGAGGGAGICAAACVTAAAAATASAAAAVDTPCRTKDAAKRPRGSTCPAQALRKHACCLLCCRVCGCSSLFAGDPAKCCCCGAGPSASSELFLCVLSCLALLHCLPAGWTLLR